MKNLRNSETKYLQAKIDYYEGHTTMSDADFDRLEEELKSLGSKVVEQIGHKRSDFDFPHPTRMMSLDKIQTQEIDGIVDYKEAEFLKWYNKMLDVLKFSGTSQVELDNLILTYSPKFDGNAINIIYVDNKLSAILTRGDGKTGKNVTDRLKSLVPEFIDCTYQGLTLEIRCEAVMEIKLFEELNMKRLENGLELFANPRNIVAGALSSDAVDYDLISRITLMPLHFILDGKQIPPISFLNSDDIYTTFHFSEYVGLLKTMIEFRKTSNIQLDGVVISLPIKYNKILGIHSSGKYPNYSLAVKFVADEVTTEVLGIEWNVGRTGELSPVVLLKPVELAGTIVKRASGYNAGYILSEGIGTGSVISICKAGDIIPEIQTVISPNFDIVLPDFCPDCQTKLDLDDIHLRCTNPECPGKLAKILHATAKAIDIKACGSEVFKKFGGDFKNLYQLLTFVIANQNNHEAFTVYGFKPNSRSLQIFIDAFTNIKSLTYAEAILLFGVQNVGLKLAEQVAKLYNGIEPDFTGQQRALVELFQLKKNKEFLKREINYLENNLGIKIDKPSNKNLNVNTMKKNESIFVCMTGSPKPNWKTKEEFILSVEGNFIDCEITNKDCQYLITNDIHSTTSKMTKARDRNIPIMTYEEFAEKFAE